MRLKLILKVVISRLIGNLSIYLKMPGSSTRIYASDGGHRASFVLNESGFQAKNELQEIP